MISPVSEAFCRWAADLLVDQLSDGEVPDGFTPGDLKWPPMLDVLRSRLDRVPRGVLISYLANPETVMWGAVLSRGRSGDDITGALHQAFQRIETGERKIALLHHLSARDLPHAISHELFEWAQANAPMVIDEQREAFADRNGSERLARRLEDPTYASKRWVYMYSLHALGAAQARPLLKDFAEKDQDPLVRAAAKDSMQYLTPRAFLCYRRGDVPDFVGRIHDRLTNDLGADAATFDAAAIEAGADWRSEIRHLLEDASHVFVVVGPNWEPDRLHLEHDVVAHELRTALRMGLPLCLIVRYPARPPAEQTLPSDLREVLDAQAFFVSEDPGFHASLDKVIAYLDASVSLP